MGDVISRGDDLMKHDLDYYLSLNYPIEIIRSEEGAFAFHPDLDGCAAQGDTIGEAISNLDSARQLWLAVRVKDGLSIEEPVNEDECNGRYSLRMSPSLHAEVLRISRRQGISLNQFLNNIISEYVGGNRMQQLALDVARELKSAMAVTTTVSPQIPSIPRSRAVSAGSAKGRPRRESWE
jgi:antitoxin HicB